MATPTKRTSPPQRTGTPSSDATAKRSTMSWRSLGSPGASAHRDRGAGVDDAARSARGRRATGGRPRAPDPPTLPSPTSPSCETSVRWTWSAPSAACSSCIRAAPTASGVRADSSAAERRWAERSGEFSRRGAIQVASADGRRGLIERRHAWRANRRRRSPGRTARTSRAASRTRASGRRSGCPGCAGAGVAVAPVFVPVAAPPDAPVLPVSAGVGVAVAVAPGVAEAEGVADAETSAAPFWWGTLRSAGAPGTSSTAAESPPQPAASSTRARRGSRSVERSRCTAERVSAGARPCGGRTWGSR